MGLRLDAFRQATAPGAPRGLDHPSRVPCGAGCTFGLELWFTAPFKREVVWAYNLEHLRFLKEFVGADLRQRVPNRNSSLASRLPRWMKLAKNRAALMSVLDDIAKRASSV